MEWEEGQGKAEEWDGAAGPVKVEEAGGLQNEAVAHIHPS